MKQIRLLFASILLPLLSSLPAHAATTIKMQVEGLVCAFCGSAIEKKLRSHAATADVLVSLEHKVVALSLKDGLDIPDDTLRAQITDAGYRVRRMERVPESLDSLRATLKGTSDGGR
ncbi:heavy-metal-associated domain-containing protein [Methyloversatilis thermotolerans]|uniref:heavy-metal-associated domain-containing protein n=1 Tax=Methyloversatilis thermotolerans TaxID=1346290 RepID=UPI00036D1543|nr:heavy-metal-associated domain-containing protein [Methyloversatilis thermotolerans]